jgi:hypothetical protein
LFLGRIVRLFFGADGTRWKEIPRCCSILDDEGAWREEVLGLDETIKAEEETLVSPIVGKELLRPRPKIFPIDCIMIVNIAFNRVTENNCEIMTMCFTVR